MSEIDFINMNSTEWWMVKESIRAELCEISVSGFSEFYKTNVKMPNGDIYIIEDWDGEIMSVEKIKDSKND